MKKISRIDTYLRTTTNPRHYVSTPGEINFLHRASQDFNQMLHRSGGWGTALDKILLLFHLHKPQHHAGLRLGNLRSTVVNCATLAHHARLKISIGTFAANQG